MMDKVSVVRNAEGMTEALAEVEALRDAFTRASVQDKGEIFNTDLTETLEVGYMLDLAEATGRRSTCPRRKPRSALSDRLRKAR